MQKADPLIRTKLHLPFTRLELVSRPRLQARIAEGLRGPLTLITAPAGFGKTTLVASCIASCGMPIAWLSLDKNDNQAGRFLTYLVAALQEADHTIGSGAAQLLAALQQVPPEAVLTSLINDLDTAGREIALVLDDYQLINSQAVHDEVAFLLEHCPNTLHLVIATRSDPPLPLARLRARGETVELRAADLRFTEPEAAQFLNDVMGLGLDAGPVTVLAERTEGWIAGLQMAALSMRDREDVLGFIERFSGTNRYILDYLVEEVLSLQPGDIQAFLLQTCVLERLCGPLCDALTADRTSLCAMEDQADSLRSALAPIVPTEGQAEQGQIRSSHVSGQATIEYLERANLFVVPLDEERKWYRYHHLFADLLRGRLLQFYGDRQVQALHARAATWYEENGLLAEAIEHALSAHDTERACRLVESIADSEWLSGEFYQVLRWIEALPRDAMLSRPWLCVWYAWSRLQAGTVHGVEELIDYAERAARTHHGESSAPGLAQDEALTEQIAALRVTCAGLRQEKTDKTIELAGRALERSAASNRPASLLARSNVLNVLGFAYYVRGELYQAEQAYREARRVAHESDFVLRELLVVHKLANIYQIMGRLLEPYQLYQEALACLQEQGRGVFFAAGYLYCGLSHLLYEWNRFDQAQQMIAQSLRLNELVQVPHLTIDICHAQAQLFLAQGDVDGAQIALQEAAHLIQTHYCWPEVVSANQCLQARLWLARGDMSSAVRWAESNRPVGLEGLDFAREMSEITRARVLLAQSLLDEAVSLLGRLASSAEAGARTGRLIEILALQALGLSMIHAREQQQDTTKPEVKALERSLALAKPEGYLRLFLDMGPPMATLLRQAAARGIEPGYVHKLLDAFPVQAGAGRAVASGIHSPFGRRSVPSSLVEPLTGRELEVLRLVAEGLSNREIAERLVVAIGTVKAHIHSICGKLDAQNRTQALLRAQQLGLLT